MRPGQTPLTLSLLAPTHGGLRLQGTVRRRKTTRFATNKAWRIAGSCPGVPKQGAASRARGQRCFRALEPHDLLVRLCASIPPPWFNMIRYFGVLSSHSRHRARVVPSVVEAARFAPQAATGDQLELDFSSAAGADTAPNHARSRWGWLLRHVFRADVETCPRCGGPTRWVEAATEQGAIARLLAKHRLAPEPAPEPRARAASGQLPLPFS